MADRSAGAAQAALVAQTATGHRQELPMAEDHSVHALKEAVQAATGVPTATRSSTAASSSRRLAWPCFISW